MLTLAEPTMAPALVGAVIFIKLEDILTLVPRHATMSKSLVGRISELSPQGMLYTPIAWLLFRALIVSKLLSLALIKLRASVIAVFKSGASVRAPIKVMFSDPIWRLAANKKQPPASLVLPVFMPNTPS